MNELIEKIKEVSGDLIGYDMDSYAAHAQEMVDMMTALFPKIISSYSDPRMADHAEDAGYWMGQLERIVNAVSSVDDLAVIDVLYNETRPNLIELKGILEDRGVTL